MRLKEVECADDLQRFGSAADVRALLEAEVAPLKVTAETYEQLYEVVTVLKQKWVEFLPGPFVSEEAEFVYYLTELEGEKQLEALGITEQHFSDQKAAKKWFKSIAQKVHSDKKRGSDEAFAKLKEIYNVLTFRGESDDER
ncbi:hypothetical protein [Burkholderia gladioli]|uniref:hypothetical protein n=1 Tax=Burkholderia gladioli TaxID=28095 RepID=UPI00264F9AEE|nr:hypothetical protein [Burkholderia gladioli]MDN7755140.1 hypothetical protein [Burkholderia gladioli]